MAANLVVNLAVMVVLAELAMLLPHNQKMVNFLPLGMIRLHHVCESDDLYCSCAIRRWQCSQDRPVLEELNHRF